MEDLEGRLYNLGIVDADFWPLEEVTYEPG
jgi:hypothetical protein